MTLPELYGWNDFHRQHYTEFKQNGQPYGRVVSIKGFKYTLITAAGFLESELAGKLLYGVETEALPKVGDWVLYLDYGDSGYITDVLPRMNALSRKNPGNKTERQILAVNIDYALIVQGLDANFNTMRLERYIVQIVACGIKPVIIMNKTDLVDSITPYAAEIAKLKRDGEVYFCSTVTGEGIESILNVLEEYKTYILIGSSGVGKSSLLNSLLKHSVQETKSVSESNQKGRHTTTTRDLFQLTSNALVIDTPGMREFGVTFEEGQHSSALFPAIDILAAACRYADCLHVDEPGCAVLEALHETRLDPVVYESYIKLMKEQKRFMIKAEDKKRLGKQFGKMTKEARDFRKKYKY